MKKYVILFAIFLTGIFFYPVIAQAETIEMYVSQNLLKEYSGFLILGSGLVIGYNMIRSLVPQERTGRK